MKKQILLDSEWTRDGEADDMIEYYKKCNQHMRSNYELLILSNAELSMMQHGLFFTGTVYGNSEMIQKHLRDYNPRVAEQVIPDTYDFAFTEFYHRDIEIITLHELYDKYLSNGISRFIKPLGNDKSFDGQVISVGADYDDLAALFGNNPSLTGDTQVYACRPIDITGEIRLLIGAGKLYGHAQISVKPPPNQNYLSREPSSDSCDTKNLFLDKLITATDDRFLCVDIGWIPELDRWVVIEVNPPFSLDDYDMPITDYLAFCEDAFEWIRSTLGIA